ncbi:MAG: flagellar motor switch protein FliN [Thermosediminibacterales bacterium]|nr:flagellar motor switch protein FliN [Thermosediminibacterales bacterium]
MDMNEKDMLSQEEIDALLNNDIDTNDVGANYVNEEEKDALGEIGNISMGASATTLYTILGKRVRITTPKVVTTTVKQLREDYPIPFVSVEVRYTHGIKGTNILIIKETDAKIIADLMMGGDGRNVDSVELDEIRFSAISEAMNQMMGAAATSMSTVFKTDINISPPTLKLINLSNEAEKIGAFNADEEIVRVSFKMEVENLIKSEIMQLIPVPFAKQMVRNLMFKESEEISFQSKTEPQTEKKYQETGEVSDEGFNNSTSIPVKPVRFDNLQDRSASVSNNKIDLLMDIPLEVTVELGRTSKLIKDILKLGPGSIIELEKLAGEPVDILVNGKFIAKGEVVVIDENFGVRITEIIKPIERINNLQ